ncbi:hypothetical protein ECG_01778 [Echinococcus granulosus]|nr:hypothetical protein ECG_01778 [Echinococcus granulosus]
MRARTPRMGSPRSSQLHRCMTKPSTQPGSPAEGQLHCGDEIHEINGQDTRTLSHSQATESIKAAGKDLKLTISKSLESDFSNPKVQPQNSFGRQ